MIDNYSELVRQIGELHESNHQLRAEKQQLEQLVKRMHAVAIPDGIPIRGLVEDIQGLRADLGHWVGVAAEETTKRVQLEQQLAKAHANLEAKDKRHQQRLNEVCGERNKAQGKLAELRKREAALPGATEASIHIAELEANIRELQRKDIQHSKMLAELLPAQAKLKEQTRVDSREKGELKAQLTALQEENKRLREELAFYSDTANHQRPLLHTREITAVALDGGQRARMALGKTKEGKSSANNN